jgi:cellulose synthase/poly-beta-1,6-N-acetylglucosamine synthase-like glycosyltransferase
MTEDIESTWHLLYKGWKARMCLATTTYTVAPTSFKVWRKQRVRWNMGGLQTAWRYKKAFFRKGMFGLFVVPFFISAFFLGFFGLALFLYLIVKRFLLTYFYTRYTVVAATSFFTMEDVFFTPSVLNYYGLALFLLGLVFTLFGLKIMKETGLRKGNFFNLFIYLIIYMTAYPILLVPAVWRLARGKFEWGDKI